MPSSFGSIELDVQAGRQRHSGPPEPDTPFRIAVLGDFSGRENRGIVDTDIAARKTFRIDRDNIDQVLARIQPQLCLPEAGTIRFSEFEDFHPDRLYALPLFRMIEQGAQAAPRPVTAVPEAATTPAPAPKRRISLDELLDSTEERGLARRPADDLSRIVDEIVRPHLVPKPDPAQVETQSAMEAAASECMRTVLHNPAFKALEAAWQGVFFLIRRLETGTDLQVHLIDISKAEIAADLLPADDLRHTGLWRLMVEKTVGTPGAVPWSVIACDYWFDSSLDDVDLLARLAMLARAAGAPVIAGASPKIVGASSLRDQPRPEAWHPDPVSSGYWARLRQMPEAAWAGLALPRFLLRMPYGAGSNAIESFGFEEFAGAPEHEEYLWGNPAFACACLLGQAFTQAGWSMAPGMVREIAGLPAHTYREDGETVLKPCAEVLLTEYAADAMFELGLMPLASLKGRDAVRLLRFQSIADPPSALAGPWE
ncbi:MAG: type VI secretion system contractile sheath domain-containing protein [bacterium]|jgi:type VI secretion system protein ImpC